MSVRFPIRFGENAAEQDRGLASAVDVRPAGLPESIAHSSLERRRHRSLTPEIAQMGAQNRNKRVLHASMHLVAMGSPKLGSLQSVDQIRSRSTRAERM